VLVLLLKRRTPTGILVVITFEVCCPPCWLPQDKTSFSNGVMDIRMDGSSGARLYYPMAMEYGLVEVTAKVSGISGVVSAFYVSRHGALAS
jgi:hypothetical protein